MLKAAKIAFQEVIRGSYRNYPIKTFKTTENKKSKQGTPLSSRIFSTAWRNGKWCWKSPAGQGLGLRQWHGPPRLGRRCRQGHWSAWFSRCPHPPWSTESLCCPWRRSEAWPRPPRAFHPAIKNWDQLRSGRVFYLSRRKIGTVEFMWFVEFVETPSACWLCVVSGLLLSTDYMLLTTDLDVSQQPFLISVCPSIGKFGWDQGVRKI